MSNVWTNEEILKLWPQAEGELQGFQRAMLERKVGITAAQLEMALQLAKAEYERILARQPGPACLECGGAGVEVCRGCNDTGINRGGEDCQDCIRGTPSCTRCGGNGLADPSKK